MDSTNLASVRIIVYGRVQQVYFRDFTLRHARELGLAGYVRNLPEGKTVEVQAEGEKEKIARLIDFLKIGPPAAKVDKVETTWSEYTGSYFSFNIKY
ncbi:MAG: acylphosphatase [Dehalococcoidales bacterium]|nr:acylphosphatase [Dehalococcoidales bacterium]